MMRSDYLMYIVAVIFFVLTSAVLIYQVEMKELWVLATAVLGLLFIGLGYSQRPRTQMTTALAETPTTPPPPAPPQQVETAAPATVTTTETAEQPAEAAVDVVPPPPELTKVKGIGSIRAKQLSDLGINTIQELSNASPRSLARKMDISPKITAKWIENAKQLAEKS